MALHSASLLNRGFRQLGNGLFDILDMFTLLSMSCPQIKQSRKVFTRNAVIFRKKKLKAFFHFLYVLFGSQV